MQMADTARLDQSKQQDEVMLQLGVVRRAVGYVRQFNSKYPAAISCYGEAIALFRKLPGACVYGLRVMSQRTRCIGLVLLASAN